MQINSSETVKETSLPWYRYGMVWMVIALPLIVVIASMITMSIAFKNSPEVVPSNQQSMPETEPLVPESTNSPVQGIGE